MNGVERVAFVYWYYQISASTCYVYHASSSQTREPKGSAQFRPPDKKKGRIYRIQRESPALLYSMNADYSRPQPTRPLLTPNLPRSSLKFSTCLQRCSADQCSNVVADRLLSPPQRPLLFTLCLHSLPPFFVIFIRSVAGPGHRDGGPDDSWDGSRHGRGFSQIARHGCGRRHM